MDYRISKNERGATLLESAFALPVFFLFIFATLELFWIGYNSVVIQHVATISMRRANTIELLSGNLAPNSSSLVEIKAWRAGEVINDVIAQANTYGIAIAPSEIQIVSIDFDYVNPGEETWKSPGATQEELNIFLRFWGRLEPNSGGVGSDWTILTIQKTIPLFLGFVGGPTVTVNGTAFGRNENFQSTF